MGLDKKNEKYCIKALKYQKLYLFLQSFLVKINKEEKSSLKCHFSSAGRATDL